MIKEIIVINNNYNAIPDDLDKFTFLTIYFPLNCCKKKKKEVEIHIYYNNITLWFTNNLDFENWFFYWGNHKSKRLYL